MKENDKVAVEEIIYPIDSKNFKVFFKKITKLSFSQRGLIPSLEARFIETNYKNSHSDSLTNSGNTFL